MAVLREEQRHQLRMHGLVRAEVSAEEAADELTVYGSVISWEMYVFETAENALEIASELLHLGGFACTVQAFKDYQHNVVVWFIIQS